MSNRRTEQSDDRNLILDAARFFAAVGVVWIHVCQSPSTSYWASLGRFAVPFFAAASGYFTIRSLGKQPKIAFLPFVRSRFSRLYLPFLCWSIFYAAFRAAKDLAFDSDDVSIPIWDVITTGSAYHLWFIPFLMIASFGVYALDRFATNNDDNLQGCIYGCYLAGVVLCLGLMSVPDVDSVAYFMAMATPGLLWGCSLAWLHQLKLSRISSSRASDAVPLAGIGIVLFIISTAGTALLTRTPLLENAAGVTLLIVALQLGQARLQLPIAIPEVFSPSQLGKVALGIYFSHLVFVKAGEVLARRWNDDYQLPTAVAIATISIILAASLSLLAARHRYTRWLVA